ncbi:MAG TPA: helix-turn-helix domain-containing GNAT family N-acetyltransferase [Candidatus Sulfotelmatobacter sp.]|jgi:DNA-binding MarR family transcriptional regulator/N-acetylglutamate synthase-like GNAT family acetyltransferase
MANPGANSAVETAISAVRSFNRFYTRHIGVLNEHLLESEFSLTEVRVLYELAHRKGLTAAELCKELALDPGYLSRMLRDFEKQGLLARTESETDARQSLLSLTTKGRKAFAPLDARSQKQVGGVLGKLSPVRQKRLLDAMHTIEGQLGAEPREGAPYLLRPHRAGDMGWVVHRHGVLYSQEYGYDERFEALVAEIVADFVQKFDPKRDACWIAEKENEIVGSIFLVKKSKTVAKLRLLLVEPSARGMGIGKRLIEECVRFARQAGYKKIVLWTQNELLAARHLYEQAGFKLSGEKRHDSWGRKSLVAQTWELKL